MTIKKSFRQQVLYMNKIEEEIKKILAEINNDLENAKINKKISLSNFSLEDGWEMKSCKKDILPESMCKIIFDEINLSENNTHENNEPTPEQVKEYYQKLNVERLEVHKHEQQYPDSNSIFIKAIELIKSTPRSNNEKVYIFPSSNFYDCFSAKFYNDINNATMSLLSSDDLSKLVEHYKITTEVNSHQSYFRQNNHN